MARPRATPRMMASGAKPGMGRVMVVVVGCVVEKVEVEKLDVKSVDQVVVVVVDVDHDVLVVVRYVVVVTVQHGTVVVVVEVKRKMRITASFSNVGR